MNYRGKTLYYAPVIRNIYGELDLNTAILCTGVINNQVIDLITGKVYKVGVTSTDEACVYPPFEFGSWISDIEKDFGCNIYLYSTLLDFACILNKRYSFSIKLPENLPTLFNVRHIGEIVVSKIKTIKGKRQC
jgi:hypothetical protein